MSFHAMSAKLDELRALFSSASANAERIGALTAERDQLKANLSTLASERDTLRASLDEATAKAAQAKADADAKAQEAADAKAEIERLKANPGAQAAAILAQVGHGGVSAGAGTSSDATPKLDPNLKGIARAKAAMAIARAKTQV